MYPGIKYQSVLRFGRSPAIARPCSIFSHVCTCTRVLQVAWEAPEAKIDRGLAWSVSATQASTFVNPTCRFMFPCAVELQIAIPLRYFGP